jgi:hypothetical protein
MKKLIFILTLLVSFPSVAEDLRSKLVSVAESQVGVREKTGKNDGKEVEKYLHTTGLGKGYAWCAAFLTWCHNEVNIPNPKSAYSPDWFRSNVVYERMQLKDMGFISKPGQVFGLYFESKRRIAHVGMITGETKFSYNTIEGNTNDGGSRDGDGVYKMIRNKRSIYMIADYAMSREEKRKYLRK